MSFTAREQNRTELTTTTPWVKKKTRHQTLSHNFTNYYPIFKIFSLKDSVVNLQQTLFKNSTTLETRRYTTLWNMNVTKWHHSEIRIAINDDSQGSIAKNLRCDEWLYYTFIIHSAGERIFKIGEHLATGQNRWVCHIPHSPCTFVLKDADLAR